MGGRLLLVVIGVAGLVALAVACQHSSEPDAAPTSRCPEGNADEQVATTVITACGVSTTDAGSVGAQLALCLGSPVTIRADLGGSPTLGTSGDDVIAGTSGDDDIRGGGGDDTICAGDGDDIVHGGPGDDRIELGRGHDLALGGSGHDVVLGGRGRDQLRGQRGGDTLDGGPGADVLFGGRHADTLSGGPGRDILRGGRGSDRCRGGAGSDELTGCADLRCRRHVSTTGSDDGTGQQDDPWATVTHAAEEVPDAHCVVVVHDGVYPGTVDIDRRFASSLTVAAATLHGAVLESSSAAVDIDGARNITLDGFEIRHTPGADAMVVSVSGSGTTFAEGIVLRNSIVHDSYDDDLIKFNQGVRDAVVANTITYNPGPGEHHYDLNGVEDVELRNNVMFNDYEGSGREQPPGKMFVVIKDSNTTGLDLGGSHRVTVDGNVFIGWAVGGEREPMVKAGNDGKPHFEAVDVVFENNLFLSNGPDEAWAVFGAAGVSNLTIRNNTVNGVDARYPGYRLEVKGENPPNEGVVVCNNVWSTTMADFSKVTGPVTGLTENDNVYWNDGDDVPDFEPGHGRVSDPGLDLTEVVRPREGDARSWLRRLVEEHGTPNDVVVDRADATCASDHDILGAPRGRAPDVGALERPAEPAA